MEQFEKPSQFEKTGEEATEKKDEEKEDFINNTFESEKRERMDQETELVIENPDWVGINFDHEFIVDGRNFWSLEQTLDYLKQRDGVIPPDTLSKVEAGEAQTIIEERQKSEKQKMEKFREYVESFSGKIKHIRINPAGETSSISPSQAIEVKEDESFEIKISPEFIKQIKVLAEQCEDVTLVVPFYDHRRGKEKASDVPETEEQIQQYIALSQDIIERTGGRVKLEIGNETNVLRNTAAMFADKLQHASHVNSSEYANFYYKVARNIKEKFPEAKLSVAGVACFDPTYLREVLTEVKRLQTGNEIDTTLVDTISFHPYREKPEGGSIEVKNGNFTISELDYERQMEEMQKIASEFGVKLTVGEINFPFSDPEQRTKLEQAVSLTAKKEIESLIYPGVHVH